MTMHGILNSWINLYSYSFVFGKIVIIYAWHSGFVGGGLGILGSNFFIVFFASWGLLTCIGVGKNATNHLKGSISVPNPCLLWPKMSILHCYLQYCMKFLLPRKTFYLAEKSCYTMIFWDKIDIWKPVRMPYSLKNLVWKFNFCLKISYYQVMCFFYATPI